MPHQRANQGAYAIVSTVAEMLFISPAYLWAIHMTIDSGDNLMAHLADQLPYLTVFLALWAVGSVVRQLGDDNFDHSLESHLYIVTKSVAQTLVVCTVLFAVFTREPSDRDFLMYFVIGCVVSLFTGRVALRAFGRNLKRHGIRARRVLIVGSNERAARIVQEFRKRPGLGYEAVGYLDDEPDRSIHMGELDLPYWGTLDPIDTALAQGDVDEIFVVLPIQSFYGKIQQIAEQGKAAGISVRLVADLFPLRIAKNKLMHAGPIPIVSLSTIPEEQTRLAIKRALDFVLSTVLLLLLSPMFVLLAILIKSTSPGPVFFAQERVGQNKRRFNMLKFRSMVVNAEELRAELEEMNEAEGPVFKIKKDPRITPIGGFIRKYSLDEFPQLLNVWRGQMSLVGPRPPLASEVDQYTWNQRRRLSVKPGMTGLWQVSGRSDVGFDEWVELDLQYIDTWSILNDLWILMRTFGAVIQGRGAS